MQEVVGEVLLDDVALVATANDKIIYAMGGIQLHDVPQDWSAADFDHWLGLEIGFF